MTFVITEKGIYCGSCESFCKNHAISAGDMLYVIDEEKCDQCGDCREYCPIDDVIQEKAGLPAKP